MSYKQYKKQELIPFLLFAFCSHNTIASLLNSLLIIIDNLTNMMKYIKITYIKQTVHPVCVFWARLACPDKPVF